MDLKEEFYEETGKKADDGYRYYNHYVEWLKDKLDANQKDMDFEAEFYEETKMKAYSNLTGRYTNYYVEWLEERLEREIMKSESYKPKYRKLR
jgi:hypothetical protein